MSGVDLFGMLGQTEFGQDLLRRMQPPNDLGEYERMRTYRTCADGWIIGYTTTRTVGGRYDGKFVMVVYKPYGEGSRGGAKTARQWKLTQHRGFSTRKAAKARAESLWLKHEGRT